ncbi:hypothetical protein MLD38_000376 [Melastoma candidum]|uniref:Uncharacterized protein n=1 Tax=Melastoma candidum TaxID=119954 RepID=A0ACB9SBF9_9MYRT|nr:hypothetical protein MLD38_000376 [Melastoma candidum]
MPNNILVRILGVVSAPTEEEADAGAVPHCPTEGSRESLHRGREASPVSRDSDVHKVMTAERAVPLTTSPSVTASSPSWTCPSFSCPDSRRSSVLPAIPPTALPLLGNAAASTAPPSS